jgi:hypothetical protein
LGAVTPKYDEVAELYSVLGERFVLYRPLRRDPEAEACAAVARASEGTDWRVAVADVAARMVQSATRRLAGVSILEWATGRLIDLARLTAAGRATVPREGDSKVIRVLAEPEGPARLVQQYRKLLRGLCAVRALAEPGSEELAIVAKVARDTMPKARLVFLAALTKKGGTKQEVADLRGISATPSEPWNRAPRRPPHLRRRAARQAPEPARMALFRHRRENESAGRAATPRWEWWTILDLNQ